MLPGFKDSAECGDIIRGVEKEGVRGAVAPPLSNKGGEQLPASPLLFARNYVATYL